MDVDDPYSNPLYADKLKQRDVPIPGDTDDDHSKIVPSKPGPGDDPDAKNATAGGSGGVTAVIVIVILLVIGGAIGVILYKRH